MSTAFSNSVAMTFFDPDLTGDARYVSAGSKWGGPPGTGVDLTFSFPRGETYFVDGYDNADPRSGPIGEYSDWSTVRAVEEPGIVLTLARLSAVADIRFTEVPDDQNTVGDIRFARSGILPNDAYAYAYYPSDSPIGGDIWLNEDSFNTGFAPIVEGEYDFLAVMHEVGHAIGLKHPFEFPDRIPAGFDNYFYTIMSYTASPFSEQDNNFASFHPTTPMFYDILALQAIYGRNTDHNAGDTTYSFRNDGTKYFQTIDDAGGFDTVEVVENPGDRVLNCVIDLNPGKFSSFGGVIEFSPGSSSMTVCIGPDTFIEQAIGGSGSDRLFGNFLSNILVGRNGNDQLTGGEGADSLAGGSGSDVISGGSGDDTLVGGSGDDLLRGSSGTDVAEFTGTVAARVRLAVTTAQDTGHGIDLITGIEHLVSGSGNDTLVGDTLANMLSGGLGNDRLSGKVGNDTLDGSDGDDTLIGSDGNDVVQGGDGVDTAVFSATGGASVDLRILTAQDTGSGRDLLSGIENLTGGVGSDSLVGDGQANLLKGDRGDDTLVGGIGDDTLQGNSGGDLMNGGTGFDTVDYSSATSDLRLSLANDGVGLGAAAGDAFVSIERVLGGSGNDALSGDGFDNWLYGGGGDDTLEGGAGNDLLFGDGGTDRAVFSGNASVFVNLNVTTAQNTGLGLDILDGIESVTSGNGDDSLVGNDLANRLAGGAGRDSLFGGDGDDTLKGDDGDDLLDGGRGTNRLDGGAGTDTAVFSGAAGLVLSLSLTGQQQSGQGLVTLKSVENLTGGTGADLLSGDSLANRLDGGNGHDTLRGGGGSDSLTGGAGDDHLFGGSGADLLAGGIGADRFVFATGNGDDRINDFEDGIDRIAISSGAERFGDLVLVASGADTVISFADVSITLAGIGSAFVTAEDFLFV